MFSNFSASGSDSTLNYPITDSTLPFADYISQCRGLIAARRTDLGRPGINATHIIDANSPYELYPAHPVMAGERIKYGVLLIHGLLDSPFTLRDIGSHLQSQGILCRSILLPGHGTVPDDLLAISYHSWIQAVRYGIDSLKKDVEQIYLIGYSTGATLSVYHALQDPQISGIILLAPAIKIRPPVDVFTSLRYLSKWMTDNRKWLYREVEADYMKYASIAFNPVNQVAQLTSVIRDLHHDHPVECPVFMAVSREDETISSERAISFFSSLKNPDSELLLYTSFEHRYPDQRITTRLSTLPEANIKHFSHVSIPFAPENPYYGKDGEYIFASHPGSDNYIYGAYNHIELKLCNYLHQIKLMKRPRRELTFNPDFPYMAHKICQFIRD